MKLNKPQINGKTCRSFFPHAVSYYFKTGCERSKAQIVKPYNNEKKVKQMRF